MYKRYDFFLLQHEEEKNRQDESKCIFSHSKQICKSASGSKCDHITKNKINADCEKVWKNSSGMEMEC